MSTTSIPLKRPGSYLVEHAKRSRDVIRNHFYSTWEQITADQNEMLQHIKQLQCEKENLMKLCKNQKDQIDQLNQEVSDRKGKQFCTTCGNVVCKTLIFCTTDCSKQGSKG